jgi:selenocysteine-specific elongation factor
LADIAELVAAKTDGGLITAAAFRDASDIGRNLAIEVLEFFNKVKFTRRVGDGHQIIRPAAEAFGDG